MLLRLHWCCWLHLTICTLVGAHTRWKAKAVGKGSEAAEKQLDRYTQPNTLLHTHRTHSCIYLHVVMPHASCVQRCVETYSISDCVGTDDHHFLPHVVDKLMLQLSTRDFDSRSCKRAAIEGTLPNIKDAPVFKQCTVYTCWHSMVPQASDVYSMQC